MLFKILAVVMSLSSGQPLGSFQSKDSYTEAECTAVMDREVAILKDALDPQVDGGVKINATCVPVDERKS